MSTLKMRSFPVDIERCAQCRPKNVHQKMLVDLKIVDLKIIDLKIIDLNTSSIFNGFIKSFPDKAGLFFKAVLHLLIL